MENATPLDVLETDQFNLNSTSVEYLRETAKWARFLSIVGFVFIGIIVLIALTAGSTLGAVMAASGSPIGGLAITIIYLLMAGLFFPPTLYLYRYSKNIKAAIETNNQSLLTEGMGNMKSVFKFWGIYMAVILSIYAVLIVFALVGGGLSALMS